MTTGECKKAALALADGLDSENPPYTDDGDTAAKLPLFISMGMRLIAQTAKITKTAQLTYSGEQTALLELPSDFYELVRVSGDTPTCLTPDRKLCVEGAGSWVIYYNAMPQEITQQTPDDFVLPVAGSAADALPYFVAAQLLMSEGDTFWVNLQSRFDAAMSAVQGVARPVKFYNA